MPDIAAEVYAALHFVAGVVSAKLSAIEADFTKWEHDTPGVETIVEDGINLGKTLLKARGVDVQHLETVGDEVMNVAKQVAAAVAVTAPPPNAEGTGVMGEKLPQHE